MKKIENLNFPKGFRIVFPSATDSQPENMFLTLISAVIPQMVAKWGLETVAESYFPCFSCLVYQKSDRSSQEAQGNIPVVT